MKAKVVKLTVYKNEDIMLIAPKNEMNKFLNYLGEMASNAGSNAMKKDCFEIAENYNEFAWQIFNCVINE